MVDRNRVQRNIERIRAAGLGEDRVQQYLATEGLTSEVPDVALEPPADPTMSGGMLSGLSNITLGWGPKLVAGVQTLPELTQGIGAWNEAYGEQAQANLDAMRLYREANPWWSLGSAVLGGAATGGGLARVLGMAPSLGNAVRLGVAEGVAYGSGESDDPLQGGITGGVVGSVTAPIGYGVAQGVGRVAQKALGRNAADEFALRKLAERIDADEARRALAEAEGKPWTLADLNEQTRGLARATTSMQGPARDIGIPAMQQRGAGRFDRMIGDLRGTLARDVPAPDQGGPRIQQRYMAAERAAAARPEYRRVVDEFGDVELTPRLAGLLRTPAARQGLNLAQVRAANLQIPPPRIMTSETGEVTGQVTFRDLDLVQRGMRQVLESVRDPVTGRLTTTRTVDPSSVASVRDRLLVMMNRMNPDYRAVRKQYADFSAAMDAYRSGNNIFREDFGDIGFDFQDMSDTSREAFTRGVYTAFKNLLSNRSVGAGANLATWTPKKEKILDEIMPADRANLLRELIRRERNMAATEGAVVGGSPTTRIREEIVDAALDPETLLSVVTGDVLATTRNEALRRLGQYLAARGQVRTQQQAENMARRLFSADRDAIRRTLDEIEGAAVRRAGFPEVALPVGLGAVPPIVDINTEGM